MGLKYSSIADEVISSFRHVELLENSGGGEEHIHILQAVQSATWTANPTGSVQEGWGWVGAQ